MGSRLKSAPVMAATAGVAMAVAALVTSCLAVADPPVNAIPVDEKQWESWWADLEKGEVEASRALLKLADRPRETVTSLKEKMKPLEIDSGKVKGLLLKLGNANEKVWKPAFEELEYFDPRLAIDLQELMDRVTESPARQRMVELLSGREAGSLAGRKIVLREVGRGEGFNFYADQFGSWWAEHKIARIKSEAWFGGKKKWTRADRAIVLLEHIGTVEAHAILKDMAGGHSEAQPTRAAKKAIETVPEKRIGAKCPGGRYHPSVLPHRD